MPVQIESSNGAIKSRPLQNIDNTLWTDPQKGISQIELANCRGRLEKNSVERDRDTNSDRDGGETDRISTIVHRDEETSC